MPITKTIEEAIKKGVEEEVKKEFDLSIEYLNKRKNQICAGIVLNIMKTVNMQTLGEKMTIEIKEIKSK